LKVPFGLLFGLTIGIMALVPFGGTVGIIMTTSVVALQDFGMGARVLLAAVIVQQILENVIAPRILGNFTGLNPVWILISVLTGARVGGLLGVIVAVPFAAIIKTIITTIRPLDMINDPELSNPSEITTSTIPETTGKEAPQNSLQVL